jgi:hypothetical protein
MLLADIHYHVPLYQYTGNWFLLPHLKPKMALQHIHLIEERNYTYRYYVYRLHAVPELLFRTLRVITVTNHT